MKRLVISAVVLGFLTATAWAEPARKAKVPPPPPATLPVVGATLGINGTASWPKLDWMYDVPQANDAAGKVVIHWFCAPRIRACSDDLARIITLRESGRVYVIAYINGSKGQAKKLDPIRESEGVGRGTVAFGSGATKLMKELGVTGPASIVVDVDGKVLLVATASTPAELDARDAKVTAASAAIKEYVSTPDGPTVAKPGDKFQLSMTIKLASWLSYSNKSPMELDVTVPPDIKCDATKLRGDQIKIADKLLTATVTCSGPKGIYEARGDLRFGYDTPAGGAGLGAEGAKWKLEIKY
ncbi:MAG TPA: hypothetical protein VHN14_33100 [Kofleriaceae bacterium]|jgi:hypothetical protein|nr:hypothetical protein [Kofleriaceae bacterium]